MDPLIIPIVALLVPVIIVPTAMGIKHARFLREVEHAERMRAMELGHPPAEEHSWTPSGLAGTIGAGVPLASLFIAFIATRQGAPETFEVIWMAAGLIGVAGVICGSILAGVQLAKGSRPSTAPADEKPSYDPEPDAFDVVGGRGGV